jgi:hypothetical protein
MKLTPEKLTAFCAALAETGIVARACKAVGISRQTAYEWREEIPEFAAAWERALRIGVTALEDEAHRRAFEGIDEPLTHQGNFTYLYDPVIGDDGEPMLDAKGNRQYKPRLDEAGNHMVASVRKYSDTLAIFLLKAHAPEKYRENSRVELAGNLNVNQMTEEEMRAELAALGAADLINPPSGADDDCSDLV